MLGNFDTRRSVYVTEPHQLNFRPQESTKVPNRSRFACVTAFVLVSVLSGYGQEDAPAPQSPAAPTSSDSEPTSTFWLASWWQPARDLMSWFFQSLPAPVVSEHPTSDQPVEASGPCSVA